MNGITMRRVLPAAALFLAVYAAVSLFSLTFRTHSFALNAFGDIAQTVALVVFCGIMLLNVRVSKGHERLFWMWMSLGAVFWLVASLAWVWYEVILRVPVPEAMATDVVFFLHIVPMMAALAVRPHRNAGNRHFEFNAIDFTLLLIWWIYLYCYVVIPWQYVSPNQTFYDVSLNVLYEVEQISLLAGFALLVMSSTGPWKAIYRHFMLAASLYAFGSAILNQAIAKHTYYTGSLFDLPLVGAMLWFVMAGTLALELKPEPSPESGSGSRSVVASRLAMAAVLSLPVMGLWGYTVSDAPPAVRSFRGYITLAALFLLPLLLFIKQHLLDRALMRLLSESERYVSDLKRMQDQLVQTEKLAALGQLVGGATHEINNPLAAILGYTDLLLADPSLPQEKQKWIVKLGEQARRTRDLVNNLLSFARQIQVEKTPVQMNLLVSDALHLRSLEMQDLQILIEKELQPGLPDVIGDNNQLLQVCFHIIGNALDAMRKPQGGVLTVSTGVDSGCVYLRFADTGPGVEDPQRIFDPFYSTKALGKRAGLGLSACYGVILAHKGQITCQNRPQGGAVFTVLLPLQQSAAAKTGAAV
jgi:signal transduction histidine kinase